MFAKLNFKLANIKPHTQKFIKWIYVFSAVFKHKPLCGSYLKAHELDGNAQKLDNSKALYDQCNHVS